jgi:hypothetical protein
MEGRMKFEIGENLTDVLIVIVLCIAITTFGMYQMGGK